MYDRSPVRELSRFERWYGRDELPVERRPLRAGRLTAKLEGPDLRYVRAGGVEVVRRLYAAVRDQNWGTVAPQLQNVRLEEGDDGFRLEFDARNADPALGVDLSWHGEIVGGSDGSLACTFDGTANAAFRYNRIGWCVLHPAENAGKRYRARTPDGVVEGRLPAEVGAQEIVGGLPAPLFPSFDEVEIEVADGVWARFELEGDLFETEDQRNWTDASFKTYSTPLSLGFPHQASAGQRFRQAVRLTVTGSPPSPDDPDGEVRIELGDTVGRLPALGLGAASHGRPLSERDVALLGALRLDHVRLDADLTQPGWRETLARGVADARALDVPLELAVFVGEDDGPIAELAGSLRSDRPAIARVLAFRWESRRARRRRSADFATASATPWARPRSTEGRTSSSPISTASARSSSRSRASRGRSTRPSTPTTTRRLRKRRRCTGRRCARRAPSAATCRSR